MLDTIAKSDNIKYLGILDRGEYEKLIVNMDILVNPHREDINDLFPSKIFDYISTGNIVVSSNCRDISLIQYKNLYIYKNESLDSFLYKIIKEQPKAINDEEVFIIYSMENAAKEIRALFN